MLTVIIMDSGAAKIPKTQNIRITNILTWYEMVYSTMLPPDDPFLSSFIVF